MTNKTKEKVYYFVACGYYMSPNIDSLEDAVIDFNSTVNGEFQKDVDEQRTVCIYSSSEVNSDFSIGVVKTWYPGDAVE